MVQHVLHRAPRMVCPSVLYYVSLSRMRIRKKSLILSTKSIYIRFKSINAQQKTLSKILKFNNDCNVMTVTHI